MLATPQLSLPPELLSGVFPFHLVLDRELQVTQTGPVLARLLPGLSQGGKLDQFFRIARPEVPIDFEAIGREPNTVFVLEALSKALQLKGQMIHLNQSEVLLFLGSPWVTDIAKLAPLGLTLADFATHESTPDFLFLLQAQSVSLSDSKRISDKMASQRARMRAANQRLAAQNGVTRILSEANTEEMAAPRILQAICLGIGAELGAFWSVVRPDGVLRCLSLWSAPDSDAQELKTLTLEAALDRGEELPGQVFSSGQLEWGVDSVSEGGSRRGSAARGAGLRGTLAFPFVFENEVLGVIELFRREAWKHEDHLHQMMSVLGSQIGLFVEQTRVREAMMTAQQALLKQLSTPLIPIHERVVVMPLIGAMDEGRIQQVTEVLLSGITARGAQIAILDVTGVSKMDSNAVSGLVRAAQAVRLLGARVVVTGIGPEIAQMLIGFDVDLRGISIRGTLQSGIALAMKRLG